jgi:hypothetical protein
VYSGADGGKLADAAGNEVYGRLTFAAGAYTLALYTAPGGVQTVYAPAAPVTLDFSTQYLYTFELLPHDFAVAENAKYVGDDPASTAGRVNEQLLTVTALNTLSLMSFPYTTGPVSLNVNGQVISSLLGAFTVAGTGITWLPAVAGYNLATTDRVVVRCPY